MSDYSLIDSFYIDHGELEGLSPQECFTLGVEWQMVAGAADKPESFHRPIHTANAYRIGKLLLKRNRKFRIVPTGTEGWSELYVQGVLTDEVCN